MTAGIAEAAGRRLREAVAARRAARGIQIGREILVGLVGRGIQASRTPIMHEREGARIGFSYTYILIDFDQLGLVDEHLADIIDQVQDLGFAGLNVTHPFKQAILSHLDGLSSEAAAIGAVNTVVFGDGRRVGHNTDSWGFSESFRQGLLGASVSSVVQFGAGGGGAAVAYALLTSGTESLTLCDTDIDRAHRLSDRLSKRFDARLVVAADSRAALQQSAGLVNTTPVGMEKYPGLPFPAERLDPSHWVADIIYFPAETELLRFARSLGCRVLPGTGMAIYQAVKAFELLTGIVPDHAAMAEHFRAAA